MKRKDLLVASVAAAFLVALAATVLLVSGCGSADVLRVDTTASTTAATALTTSTTLSLMDQYREQLVDPATLSEPALARVVSGLLGRGIPVIGAQVTSTSPLKIRIVVPGTPKSGGWPPLVEPQLEREAAAEWKREGRLRECELDLESPSGEITPMVDMPIPEGIAVAGIGVVSETLPPTTTDLGTAAQLLQEAIAPLIEAPVELLGLELTDDVLNARLLHARLLVPDFEAQFDAFEAASRVIKSTAKQLTQEAGVGVGVVRIDALNEQNQLWCATWSDLQTGSESGSGGLVHYFPSYLPRPLTHSTTTSAVSTTTSAVSTTTSVTESLDSGITGLVTIGPISPVEQVGVPNEKPYSATIVIKRSDGTVVAQVLSGADGRFTVRLPPGTYVLEPQNGSPLPRAEAQEVTVQPHQFTEVTVRYDSGIR